jgi:hypothetical protein
MQDVISTALTSKTRTVIVPTLRLWRSDDNRHMQWETIVTASAAFGHMMDDART